MCSKKAFPSSGEGRHAAKDMTEAVAPLVKSLTSTTIQNDISTNTGKHSTAQPCPESFHLELSSQSHWKTWTITKKISFFLVFLLQQKPTVNIKKVCGSISAFTHDSSSRRVLKVQHTPYVVFCVPVMCSVEFLWGSQQNPSISGNARDWKRG